jgi:hypothetical protein
LGQQGQTNMRVYNTKRTWFHYTRHYISAVVVRTLHFSDSTYSLYYAELYFCRRRTHLAFIRFDVIYVPLMS